MKVILDEEGKGEVLLDRDYRRRFISFLKDVFAAAGREVYERLYNSRIPGGADGKRLLPPRKPFTFSVYLGKAFRTIEGSDYLLTSLPYEFLFSTGDPLIASHFYNGVLRLRSNGYSLNLSSITKAQPLHLKVGEITLAREEVIKSRAVLFKTKQPVIITAPKEPLKKEEGEEGYYVVPGDDGWEEILRQRLFEDYRRTKGKELKGDLRFKEVKNPLAMEILSRWGKLDKTFVQKPIKTTRIKHYGVHALRGFKGVFLLCGPVELLQFVYQYGMGVRTGQGFGMLDVLAQLKEEVCLEKKEN